MAANHSDRVREIAEARDCPESEIFRRALERGLEDLWEGFVIAQYLDGELDREEAVARVGRATIERAQREGDGIRRGTDQVMFGSTARFLDETLGPESREEWLIAARENDAKDER